MSGFCKSGHIYRTKILLSNIIQYVLQFTQKMPDTAHVYYIEILHYSKVANRNAITLVCYLAHTKTVIVRIHLIC